MNKIINLSLGVLLIFYLGCKSNTPENSNKEITNELEQPSNTDRVSSNKLVGEESLTTIDPRIQDLLEKTKVLQVPIIYSFEDKLNIASIENTAPLSDEMLELLNVEKIDDWIDDFSEILWLSCQVELSEKFKTLIFAVNTGGEGKNVLVNYSNSFEFIDHKHITYEDYVEGYFSKKSLIDTGRIITYNSSYEGENDTITFRIDESGRIVDLLTDK